MTDLIRSQLSTIFVMTYCGLAASLVYDFFTVFIRRFAAGRRAGRAALRLLCYLVIGLLTADFFMYCQNGRITFMGAASFLLGLWLWRRFFYDIINFGEKDEQKGEKTPGI